MGIMQKNKWQWFTRQIDVLRKQGFKNIDIAERTGLTAGHITELYKGRKPVSDDTIDLLLEKFSDLIEPANLIPYQIKEEPETISLAISSRKCIPVVPIDLAAEALAGKQFKQATPLDCFKVPLMLDADFFIHYL